jgi:hypothetical protein
LIPHLGGSFSEQGFTKQVGMNPRFAEGLYKELPETISDNKVYK